MNENHRRRLLTSLQHADKLLQECLAVLMPSSRALFSRHLEDVSPSEAHWVQSYAEKIRSQFSALLRRFDIQPPEPSILSSWVIRTNLISLDIDLEELDPEGLRGYGAIDPDAAQELAWAVGETRRLVNQLHSFLARTRSGHTPKLDGASLAPLPDGLLESLARIISRHRLVEFLPALNSITQKVESHRFEIAVFGRVSSGKSSLINRLLGTNLLPVGTTPVTTVPVHVIGGQAPGLRVHFADKVQDLAVEHLPEYATEQLNPSNRKGVVRIEAAIPSGRIQPGVAFVDTPGVASLATSGTRLAYAYLPECDIGLVLVDGHSALGPEDLDLMRALTVSGIKYVVLISKCDLLAEEDVERVSEYTRKSLVDHLGVELEVVPVSASDSWAEKLDRWFLEFISPLVGRSRDSLAASVARKLQALRESLCVTLETRLRRDSAPGKSDPELILRPVDESLAAMRSRWRDDFANPVTWNHKILDRAASKMASLIQSPGQSNHVAEVLPQAALDVVAGHCEAFLEEYENLAAKIGRVMEDGALKSQVGHSGHPPELPRPHGLPSPDVSLLGSIDVSMPGPLAKLTSHGRERHFRVELAAIADDAVRSTLAELRPRLQHWFSKTFGALEDFYHSQTDPLRYLNADQVPGSSGGESEELRKDLLFLHGETTQVRVTADTTL
jgi:GTP-binding protein EngB required for normal cell division